MAGSQRVDHRRLVDHRTPGEVHEDRPYRKPRELGGADQVMRVRRVRAGQDESIRPSEGIVELGSTDESVNARWRCSGRCPLDAPDLEAEMGQNLADAAADRPESHDQRPLAGQLSRRVALPLMGTLLRQKVRHVLGQMEQPQRRELGERHGMHAGGGREGDGPVEELFLLEELTDPGACRLDPADTWSIQRQPIRLHPVEVEQDVRLRQKGSPALEIR